MESGNSLPALTDLEIDFPTLTLSTLGQPIEPVVTFLSPHSKTIRSNSASPDAQSDIVSSTQGLSSFTVCSTPTVTTDQLQPPSISSSVGDARSKISLSCSACARPKRKLRNLQRPTSNDYNRRDRLTIAQQHKREHFTRLARAVKCLRFNPHLHCRLRPEYSSWKLLFWDSHRQDFTIQNTLLPSQRLVVPLRPITAHLQQKHKFQCLLS